MGARASDGTVRGAIARHDSAAHALAAVALLTAVLGGCGGVCRDTLEQAGSLKAAIEAVATQLRDLGSDTVAAGDAVLGERIGRAADEIERLPAALEAVRNGTAADGAAVVRQVAAELVDALVKLKADGAKAGAYASAPLNVSLALISQRLNAVPGVEFPPAVLAISPSRVDASKQARIKLYGHLPGKSNDDVVVSIGGKTTSVFRTAGGGGVFAVPEAVALAAEQTVPFTVRGKKRSGLFGLWSEDVEFQEQLAVGKAKPFSCTIETFEVHPERLEKVEADRPASYEATTAGKEGRANQHRRVAAAELFTQTVQNAASYDPSTAVVVGIEEKLFSDGAGCGHGPSGSARIVESGRAVEIDLDAPHLARRMQIDGWKIQVCEANDTRLAMTLKPTFLVARRDSGALVSQHKQTVDAGFDGARVEHRLAQGVPWVVHVTCAFSEGTERWETRTMVLSNENLEQKAKGIGARVKVEPESSVQVIKMALEPFDPLRFDDQMRSDESGAADGRKP